MIKSPRSVCLGGEKGCLKLFRNINYKISLSSDKLPTECSVCVNMGIANQELTVYGEQNNLIAKLNMNDFVPQCNKRGGAQDCCVSVLLCMFLHGIPDDHSCYSL